MWLSHKLTDLNQTDLTVKNPLSQWRVEPNQLIDRVLTVGEFGLDDEDRVGSNHNSIRISPAKAIFIFKLEPRPVEDNVIRKLFPKMLEHLPFVSSTCCQSPSAAGLLCPQRGFFQQHRCSQILHSSDLPV